MSRLTFTIPGTPQGKGRARFGRGRTYTPAKTVAYEGLVALAAQTAGAAPVSGPIALSVIARFTPPASASKATRARMLAGQERHTKKPDLDNIVKAITDGLNGVAFADDAQVCDYGTVGKIYAETAGVDVVVEVAR